MNKPNIINQKLSEIDKKYLLKQVRLYLSISSETRKNDLLYRMGTNAEVLTHTDIVKTDSNGGLLNQEQRQRVIDFINFELKIVLSNWVDVPIEISPFN